MTARRTGATLTLASMLTMLTWGTVIAAQHHLFSSLFPPDVGAGLVCALVGAFLLLRTERLPVPVILCVMGFTCSATAFTGVYRDAAALDGPLHGAPLWVAWIGEMIWLPGVTLLVPLVLLFPDGRLVSRRWRWVVGLQFFLAVSLVVVGLGDRISLVDGTPYEFAPNPTPYLSGVPTGLVDRFASVAFLGFFAVLAVSLGSLFVRRRRAIPVQRAQLTCLLYATTVTITIIVVGSLTNPPATWWVWLISLVSVAPMPAAIAVAVLRYRLYEIDRLVSRTVAYLLVLVVLAGVYVGVLIGLTTLLPDHLGPVGVAGATLGVTVLAVPLTRRVRRLVDLRFNRSRFDAERVVAVFAQQLRARPDAGDVPAELLDVLRRTVQPAHASVWTLPS